MAIELCDPRDNLERGRSVACCTLYEASSVRLSGPVLGVAPRAWVRQDPGFSWGSHGTDQHPSRSCSAWNQQDRLVISSLTGTCTETGPKCKQGSISYLLLCARTRSDLHDFICSIAEP
jgi:hypothetical protein